MNPRFTPTLNNSGPMPRVCLTRRLTTHFTNADVINPVRFNSDQLLRQLQVAVDSCHPRSHPEQTPGNVRLLCCFPFPPPWPSACLLVLPHLGSSGAPPMMRMGISCKAVLCVFLDGSGLVCLQDKGMWEWGSVALPHEIMSPEIVFIQKSDKVRNFRHWEKSVGWTF